MYYDNRPLQSYNAIFNLSVTVRSKGKTWSHKIPACIRFLKHGYKVVWLRYFKKDVKEMMSKDFYSKKLIQKINEELNKNQSKIKWNLTRDNFKQDGKFVYFRKSKKDKWRWFIAVHCLSDEQALKSADDPDINRIVFDEYRLTPEKMSRYRGNPVTDFLSIWTTIKRNNDVKVFMLGNKESVSDPFLSYFGVQELDVKFQGIKTFKDGTLAVEQSNEVPDETRTDFDAKFQKLLSGTGYGEFLYNGEIRNVDKTRLKPKPRNCSIYCCFDCGTPVTAFLDRFGNIYFEKGIDKSRTIGVDKLTDKYKRAYVISSEDRVKRFMTLNYAFKMNKVFYTDERAFEQGYKILRILGIVKGV